MVSTYLYSHIVWGRVEGATGRSPIALAARIDLHCAVERTVYVHNITYESVSGI